MKVRYCSAGELEVSCRILKKRVTRRKKESSFGNDLTVVGNDLAVVGNDLTVVGNDLTVVGNDLTVVGNDLAVVGNDLAVVGNVFTVVGKKSRASEKRVERRKKELYGTVNRLSLWDGVQKKSRIVFQLCRTFKQINQL